MLGFRELRGLLVFYQGWVSETGQFLYISNWCFVFGSLHPVIMYHSMCYERIGDLGMGGFSC